MVSGKLKAKKKFSKITVVHFAVFTGHLVYASVVVALLVRPELISLITRIPEFITKTYQKI